MRYVKQRQCTSKMSIFDAVSYPNLCSLCRPIWTQKPSCRSFPSRRCSATTTGTTSAELASSTRDMFSPRHTVSNSDNHRCQIACVTDLSSYCSPKKRYPGCVLLPKSQMGITQPRKGIFGALHRVVQKISCIF